MLMGCERVKPVQEVAGTEKATRPPLTLAHQGRNGIGAVSR